MIKTENITTTETVINFTGGIHVIVNNRGDSTVYVSKHPNIVADGDEVKAIDGGSADILRDVAIHDIRNGVLDWYGTIYVLSDGDTKIQIETTNNANFRQIVKGGGNNGTSIATSLDSVLKSGTFYQLGILAEDITLTLPENGEEIEIDFAIGNTTYNVNCDYLSLNVVSNTYYQVIFSYDKALKTWVASVISSDYTATSTTDEVTTDETA